MLMSQTVARASGGARQSRWYGDTAEVWYETDRSGRSTPWIVVRTGTPVFGVRSARNARRAMAWSVPIRSSQSRYTAGSSTVTDAPTGTQTPGPPRRPPLPVVGRH